MLVLMLEDASAILTQIENIMATRTLAVAEKYLRKNIFERLVVTLRTLIPIPTI